MRVSIGTRLLPAVLAIAGLALVQGDARALSLADANLVDLLHESTSILRGEVTTITDGVAENGLPYTEITVAISETIRGDEEGAYTFRQFGLLTPRLSADGTRMMLPAPEGLPRYAPGESVLLFMSQAASLTGLRSTYALGTGKFTFGPGRVENGHANEGLFRNVSIEPGLTTEADSLVLETEIGAVRPDDFLSLVRRAVTNSWVENCQMWRTDVGQTCNGSGGGRNAPHAPQRPGVINRESPRATTLSEGAR